MRPSSATRLDSLVFCRFSQAAAGACTAFGALALPSACVVCGRWDTSLCVPCSRMFRRATARPFRAEAAAEALPDVEVMRRDGPARPHPGDAGTVEGRNRAGSRNRYLPLPVVAAGRYGGGVPAVMLAYKNHGHVDLARPVAAALGAALHEALSGGAIVDGPGREVMLVPVPTRAGARRRRGYDPLMMLLLRLDRTGGLPAGARLAPWIRQVHPGVRLAEALGEGRLMRTGRPALDVFTSSVTGGQKGSGRRRRRSNVLGSMVVPERRHAALTGRYCLVVDDVLTTGATIGEAHRALVAAGAEVLGAVVIAATRSPAQGRADG